MTKQRQVDRAELAQAELGGADLGDVRLTRRLQHVAGLLAKKPGESLPDALGSEAELEATYRLLGNDRVSPQAILAPHVELTRQRCDDASRPLAIFDSTEVRFGGERKGLGRLTHEKGRGVFVHVGLMLEPQTREPLGVIHHETWARQGPKKNRKDARGKADSEALRWDRGVEAVFEQLPGAICVMDREADIFPLIAGMRQRSQDFVIRASHDRATIEGPLWDLVDGAVLVTTREIDLDERRARTRKSEQKLHPARISHRATLHIHTRRVTILAPGSNRNPTSRENADRIELNFVHVTEYNVPSGSAPIEWKLLTSLPVKTAAEVDDVVDSYRARWVIEELFKSLKSCCSLEERQLESVHSVSNAIAIYLPIAWIILRLRHLSRDYPDRPASGLISPFMLSCLRLFLAKIGRKPLPAEPTSKELTWAIAGLGGHITNNGEPGLLVLNRGLAKLLLATDVAAMVKTAWDM